MSAGGRAAGLAANYRAFANAVLAASVEPATTPAAIDGLPVRERHKLMLAVVRLRDEMPTWRALHGSPLSTDERFFAVMLWSWERAYEGPHARLRAARERQLINAGRAVGPVLPNLVSPGVSRPLLGTDFSKTFASVLGPMPAYRQLFGPAVHEHLFAQEPVREAEERLRKQLQPPSMSGDASAALARLGVSKRTMPPRFASVLRPYTARPYSLARSETLRDALSPVLGDALGPALRASALSGLAEQLTKGMSALGISASLRDVLGDRLATAALGPYRAQLTAVNGRAAAAQLTAARLGVAVDTSGLADVLAKALPQPLNVHSRVFGEARALSALLPALPSARIHALAALDFTSQLRDVFAPMRGVADLFVEFAEFMRVWEDDPLWFLLSVFGLNAARRLAGLSRAQVEEALLSALAEVVCEGEYVAALRQVLHDAPYLNEITRQWLDHALEHAAEGEWVQAVPPMLAGLEGALHRAATERALIVARGGKFIGVEALVKQMAVDEDYTSFLIRRVFGGIGNAFRHGRADSGERDQVLFAIVAVAGWVDFFLELSAMEVLAGELSGRLDAAIERVRSGTLQLPAAT